MQILKLWLVQLRLLNIVKSAIIFIPMAIFFKFENFDFNLFFQLLSASFFFMLITFAVYILNDLSDIDKDRLDTFKKLRPLAANEIPLFQAKLVTIFFIFTGLAGLFNHSQIVFGLGISYLILNLIYSKFAKPFPVIAAVFLSFFHLVRFSIGLAICGYLNSHLLLILFFLVFLALATALHQKEFAKVWGISKTKKLFVLASIASIITTVVFAKSEIAQEFFSKPGLLLIAPLFLLVVFIEIWLIYAKELSLNMRIFPMLKNKKLWLLFILFLPIFFFAKGLNVVF